MAKRYEGKRTIDGLVVTVNGSELSQHAEIEKYTDYGFEWSYEGESPRQLALAILADFLGDAEKAKRLSEPFMKDIIANLDNDWSLTGAEVKAAVTRLEKQ